MNDTPPHITQKVIEIIQRKSPEERLRMGSSMYDTSRQLLTRSIKEKNPYISDNALRKELFLLFYGNDFDAKTKENILNHLA